MITLGIETSCDETACALLDDDRRVLGSVISSQVKHHRPFYGVVPEIACRQHVLAIQPVLGMTLKKARRGMDDVDLISVTNGPGLVGALMVGVSFAKSLGQAMEVPFIGVNHLEAHLEPFFLGRQRVVRRFPFVGLVASGGHTCLVHARRVDSYHLIGETLDDAAGEAFDKVAKILGLGFPGGPVIERWAKQGDAARVRLPDALSGHGFDFSYSGLKTAVLYYARKHGLTAGAPGRDLRHVRDLCAAFQRVVVESLVRKSLAACKALRLRRLVVGGGVAANRLLARRLRSACDRHGIRLFYPGREHTTDNAIMVALRGFRLWRKRGADSLDLAVNPSLPFTNGGNGI